MVLKNKEDVCNFFNIKIQPWINILYRDSRKLLKVDIPIYSRNWKKKALAILQYFFYNRAYRVSGSLKKISDIDFSRYIWPDEWKTYTITDLDQICIPELTQEHEYCWETTVVYSFMQEDLQYGVRPMDIYFKIARGGGGPLLLDKETMVIYQIGSGIWVNYDYIKEFSLYKKGEKTAIDWSSIKME